MLKFKPAYDVTDRFGVARFGEADYGVVELKVGDQLRYGNLVECFPDKEGAERFAEAMEWNDVSRQIYG